MIASTKTKNIEEDSGKDTSGGKFWRTYDYSSPDIVTIMRSQKGTQYLTINCQGSVISRTKVNRPICDNLIYFDAIGRAIKREMTMPFYGEHYPDTTGIDINESSFIEWRNSQGLPLFQDDSLKDIKFLIRLFSKTQADEIKSIDYLYDYIEDLLDASQLLRVDAIIANFLKMNFSLKISISLLTIVAPKKRQLLNHNKLVAYARQKANEKNLTEKQINTILYGF